MLLEDSELEERLASPDNLMNRIVIKPMREVKENTSHIPDLVKNLLANLSKDDTNVNIAKEFNVSTHAVSQYSRGLVGERLDPALAEVVDDNIKTIEEKCKNAHGLALDAMISSLTILKPKLAADTDTKPATLARIATEMSKIAKNLTPEVKNDPTTNVLIVLHKPEAKSEAQYETIDV